MTDTIAKTYYVAYEITTPTRANKGAVDITLQVPPAHTLLRASDIRNIETWLRSNIPAQGVVLLLNIIPLASD